MLIIWFSSLGLPQKRGFVNEPFLRYDRTIMDKAMRLGQGFVQDPTVSSRYFYGGDTYAARNVDNCQGGNRNCSRVGRAPSWRDQESPQHQSAMPLSSPKGTAEICEVYNTKFCYGP